MGSLISTNAKRSEKLKLLTRTYVYLRVKNVSFSEN